jgi:uncharacterized membrane protein YecN with MAPEG domain
MAQRRQRWIDASVRQRADVMEAEGITGVELELRRIRFVLTWIAILLTLVVVVVLLGLGNP